jgi:predicted transcriptional regulator
MPSMTKSAKGKVALYVEVPPAVKAAMERLAEQHNRSVSGEVITALQEYIARHQTTEGGRKEK